MFARETRAESRLDARWLTIEFAADCEAAICIRRTIIKLNEDESASCLIIDHFSIAKHQDILLTLFLPDLTLIRSLAS